MSVQYLIVCASALLLVGHVDCGTLYNATVMRSNASSSAFATNASQLFFVPPARIVVDSITNSSDNATVAFMAFHFVDVAASDALDRGTVGPSCGVAFEPTNGYVAATLDYIIQHMGSWELAYLLNIIELNFNGSTATEPTSWAPAVWPPATPSNGTQFSFSVSDAATVDAATVAQSVAIALGVPRNITLVQVASANASKRVTVTLLGNTTSGASVGGFFSVFRDKLEVIETALVAALGLNMSLFSVDFPAASTSLPGVNKSFLSPVVFGVNFFRYPPRTHRS